MCLWLVDKLGDEDNSGEDTGNKADRANHNAQVRQ